MASHDEYLAIIRRIPKGKVATYKDIARIANNPDGAMSVGDALKKHKHAPGLPWWRVVKAGGKLADGAPDDQRRLLADEGVSCDAWGRLNLRLYQWREP